MSGRALVTHHRRTNKLEAILPLQKYGAMVVGLTLTRTASKR